MTSPVRISIAHNITKPFLGIYPKSIMNKNYGSKESSRQFSGKQGFVTKPIKNGRDIQVIRENDEDI